MIKELCYNLMEKRKKLGITIEEAVEKTKLCPSVIRDIEEGNLTNINTTYFRGFIKIYAAFLGVEIPAGIFDEILSSQKSFKEQQKKNILNKTDGLKNTELGEDTSHSGGGVNQAAAKILKRAESGKYIINKAKEKLPQKMRKNVKLVVGIVVLFLFFSVTKFIFSKIFRTREGEKVVQTQKDNLSTVRSVAVKEEAAVAAKSSNAADTIDTSLKAKRDCFVRVKVDGNLLFEGILNKGTVEMWKGSKEIEFKISDGSAVYLEVNGSPLPPLTTMRKPIKSLKITHAGISVDK